MSYYYEYYVGYKSKGKIYPLGPYNVEGKLVPIFSKTRSFASDLHRDFLHIKETEFSKKLLNDFEITNTDDCIVKYLPVTDLPADNFIKSGYFLISDVETYLKYKNEYTISELCIFRDYLTPEVYAMRMQNELLYNVKELPKRLDVDGYELDNHLCSEYVFYNYPDYSSKEYEVFLIKNAISMLDSYKYNNDGIELVVIETEG